MRVQKLLIAGVSIVGIGGGVATLLTTTSQKKDEGMFPIDEEHRDRVCLKEVPRVSGTPTESWDIEFKFWWPNKGETCEDKDGTGYYELMFTGSGEGELKQYFGNNSEFTGQENIWECLKSLKSSENSGLTANLDSCYKKHGNHRERDDNWWDKIYSKGKKVWKGDQSRR